MQLREMLRQHLEWLDDEDGTSPLPEFEGEIGWVEHDDGSSEAWGQYLLRLSLEEITLLKRENEGWRNGMHIFQMPHRSWEKGDWAYAYKGEMSDGFDSEDDAIARALLTAEEQEK